MHISALKNIAQIIFVALFLSACTGTEDINSGTNKPIDLTDAINDVQTPASDEQNPTAPGNLRLSGVTQSDSLSLIWDASTDNVALGGYYVLRDGIQITGDLLTQTSFTDTGVSAGQTYEYRVVAVDTTQNTTDSNLLLATTASAPSSPSADITPPSILAATPDNGATSIMPDAVAIIVDFNEAINPESLNGSTFTLNNGATGTVIISNGNTRAQLVPSTNLMRGTTYTATLSNVSDIEGNQQKQTYSWSFSTCGDTAESTYTISWDPVIDADLSGYKVYYGLSGTLNKSSASVNVNTQTSWVMSPAALGFKPCDTVHIAITALGTNKGESAFSTLIAEVIN
ncbi:hypothetical protein MNBD_GAMMA11-1142 [hydrothermal vent metagenome]|uniref:Fibronectin type-III domain-containing protein n=1 Tax=hydrothermal vent metagenome TaxID=652676 RepID=A0A3B0XFX5_9ZZZZ